MQPAAVPLTVLLERLVFILNALLGALGLAVSADLLAGLLELGERRDLEGAKPGFSPDRPNRSRDVVALPGRSGTRRASADAGGRTTPPDGAGDRPLGAVVMPPMNRWRWARSEERVNPGQYRPDDAPERERLKNSGQSAERLCVLNVTISIQMAAPAGPSCRSIGRPQPLVAARGVAGVQLRQ
jgi:hypothetical protein